jgi:hypothetical protein
MSGPPYKRPNNFFNNPNLIFFFTLNSLQNVIALGQPLLGEKYVAEKEKKERKIITKI